MPNRIIKESITTSCEIDNLSADEERFFYRLIVACDDYGRMDARPSVLRAKCFPLKVDQIKDKDVIGYLNALINIKLVKLYDVAGKPYLQMVTWDKHQQRRAKYSKFPAPTNGMISNDINGNHIQVNVPEESRNREYEESSTEESEAQNPPTPFENIKQLYHDTCPGLRKVKTMSETRKTHVRARWKQYDCDISVFEDLFKRTRASPFLQGKNDRNWQPDFDWLMNENNMAKVLEGKYDKGGGPGGVSDTAGSNTEKGEYDHLYE